MNTQQLLLRIMLWSLAVAAGLGIIAVGLLRSTWTWQVIGTGIATAVACAILIPISALAERPKLQAAGTVGIVVVVVEYVGAMALIWEAGRFVGWWRLDDGLIISMFFLLPAALLTTGLLCMSHTRFGRGAVRAGIVCICATFLTYNIGIWGRWDYPLSGRFWDAGNAIFCLLGLAVLCYAGDEKSLPLRLRAVGIVAAIPACAFALFEIFIPTNRATAGATFIVLTAIAACIAHANTATFCRLKPNQLWVRKISIGATIVTAIFISAILVAELLEWGAIDKDAYGRLAAATGIAASFATIALFVLWRFNTRSENIGGGETDKSNHRGQIEIICPRCKLQQSLNPGKNLCIQCELKIEINFEEPRCTNCEYLLVGLTGKNCPECGESIVIVGP
jgi:hypothetical protein